MSPISQPLSIDPTEFLFPQKTGRDSDSALTHHHLQPASRTRPFPSTPLFPLFHTTLTLTHSLSSVPGEEALAQITILIFDTDIVCVCACIITTTMPASLVFLWGHSTAICTTAPLSSSDSLPPPLRNIYPAAVGTFLALRPYFIIIKFVQGSIS